MTKNKSVPLYGHTCGHQNLEIWCWQIQNCKDVNVIVNVRFQTLYTEFEYQVNALVTILKSSGYIEFCSICCFFFCFRMMALKRRMRAICLKFLITRMMVISTLSSRSWHVSVMASTGAYR